MPPAVTGGLFRALNLGTTLMSEILAWVSLGLQVLSMALPNISRRSRKTRVVKGESEINLGFYRRRVTWTRRTEPPR